MFWRNRSRVTFGFEASDQDAEELARGLREAEAKRNRQVRAALARADLPVFAIVGWEGRAIGYGEIWDEDGSRRVSSITVGHGAWDRVGGDPLASVEIERLELVERSAAWTARRALRTLLELSRHRRQTAAPVSSLAGTLTRAGRRIAAIRPARMRTIAVDAELRPFSVCASRELWAAAWREGSLTVTVSARGVALEAVSLKRVADPEADLFPTAR